MTEEERRRQSGTVEYVPTYGQFAAAQNAGNAASNIASGIMPMTYARGGAYTPTAATPAVVKYNIDEPGGTTPGTTPETLPTTKYADNVDGLTVRQMIEEQRKASYADAEKLRERSVIDASTAYAQNKATYGANAEALAGMGLTGGGYGDYLNSRAYAQQREEIQAARAGEAAAKREADKVYYADMMAQKEKEDAAAKAEADKSNAAFIDLLEQAKTGNYTAEDIKNMAAKAGITNQADIDALTSAATTAQSNIQGEKDVAATDKQNTTYVKLLDMAMGGNFTEEVIRDLAKRMGLSDEDAEKLANAAKTTREANERENISGNISADTSDEEISNMIISGELSESNRAEAEKARTEMAADEISEAVDSEDYETADKLVEKYYQSGAYDTDERQNYYMEKTLNFIDESTDLTGDIASLAADIVKLKNDGKISNEDYRKAMQYLSERATSALISGEDTQLKYSSGGRFRITINGKTYDGGYAVEPSEDAGGNIQNILDNAMGGYPKEGSIALYDDGVYVYAKLNGKGKAAWYKASRNFFVSGGNASGNKKIYEALQDIAMHRPTPTRPEHTEAK